MPIQAFPHIFSGRDAMEDRFFWKVVAVGVVLGLFAVAYELCRNSQGPSLVPSAYAADAAPEKPTLGFENLSHDLYRAKVEGGWLVAVMPGQAQAVAITFYPDPKHEWNGGSMK
jgi:hypothetical protein